MACQDPLRPVAIAALLGGHLVLVVGRCVLVQVRRAEHLLGLWIRRGWTMKCLRLPTVTADEVTAQEETVVRVIEPAMQRVTGVLTAAQDPLVQATQPVRVRIGVKVAPVVEAVVETARGMLETSVARITAIAAIGRPMRTVTGRR